MKKIFYIAFLVFIMTPNILVEATEITYDEKVYSEQFNDSGADKLFDNLPGNVKKSLEGLGVDGTDFNKIVEITPDSVFKNILDTTKKTAPGPLKSVSMIMAVILLNALFNALKISMGDRPLSVVLGIVSTLCICIIIINPVVNFIARVAALIKGATAFLFCYIPIMVGIMVASGQAITSVAFSSGMVALGEIITQLSSGFLVPILNVFLTINVVSAISPSLNFSGVCDLFSKVVKWVLGFIMTVFSGLLSVKSLIGSAVDNVNNKTMKFVLSSFVPVVGSALGDAFSTIHGCVKVLKSGVGAFFIIGIGFIFLPVIIECIVWMISVNICAAVGDVFELSTISSLLKNTGKVISTLMAVIFCIITVLIISTVIVLTIGGGN